MTISNPNLPALREKAATLPLSPGVYLMRDREGTIIYVGKSRKLKNRVSSYFVGSGHSVKTARMVSRVADFDYILCDGEMEALTKTVVEKYGARALQYGGTQGVPELREAISARYGVPVDHIQITTSSQQGIDVCARVFLNPGDVVLTTNPAYLGALQSFRAYRAEVRDLTSAMAGVWQTAPDGTPLPSVAPAPPNVSCVVSDHLSPSGPIPLPVSGGGHARRGQFPSILPLVGRATMVAL